MLTLPLNRPQLDYEPKSLTWDSDVLPYRDKEKFLVAFNIVKKKFHKKYPECQLTLTESTHQYFEFTWDDTQPLYEYSYISFELVFFCSSKNTNTPLSDKTSYIKDLFRRMGIHLDSFSVVLSGTTYLHPIEFDGFCALGYGFHHTICRKLNENHPDLQTTTKGRSEVQIKTEKGFLSKLFQFFNRK